MLLAHSPCDKGQVLGSAEGGGYAPAARRWTLAAAIIGSGMAFLDGSVVNVALPTIQRELAANAAQMQWVVEAYALFLAALLLAGGALGDHLGRRRVFMAGTALFTAASLACGLAPSVRMLIAARALQGIGAALLVPGSLALLSAAYPRAERGAAIGTWSALSGVAAAAGPVLGGWLVEHFDWTWAFFINVPAGIVLWLLCAGRLPDDRPRALRAAAGEQAPVDWRGALLATLGLAGVVFALIEGPVAGWHSAWVLASLVSGVVALGLFVRQEMTAPAPMVPLGLFRSLDFSGANVLTLLLYAALGGGLYLLPLNLIQVQRMSSTEAGAAMLPFIVVMFVLSRAMGRVVDRYGQRLPLVIGPLIAALGFALLARPGIGARYWPDFFPAITVLGLGMAITVAPLTTTVMNAAGSAQSGVASGINNAVSRAAGLLAIAGFGVLMAHAFNLHLSAALQALALPAQVVDEVQRQADRLAGIELSATSVIDSGMAARVQEAIGSAFVAGFRAVMVLSAALAVIGAVSAGLLVRGPGRRGIAA